MLLKLVFTHPTSVLLPGKPHGWRSLEGRSPCGHEESDTTQRLHFDFSLSCTSEGNGNPLQCSCLENPRDGGAWWVAIYGVTQSRTRLKWLSSISRQFKLRISLPHLWVILYFCWIVWFQGILVGRKDHYSYPSRPIGWQNWPHGGHQP